MRFTESLGKCNCQKRKKRSKIQNNKNKNFNTMSTNIATSSAASEVVTGGTQNGREARNLAEKHRRDKLNASIQELSTMVPHAETTRRLDKTAVLRFAAHGLRLEYVFGKSVKKRWHKSLRSRETSSPDIVQMEDHEQSQPQQMSDTLMELLDSFFITLTCHGQIVVISASVEQLLGHCQSDLYGQNILHITHPEDQTLLRQQLIPRDMESLFRYNDYRQSSATDDANGMMMDDDCTDYVNESNSQLDTFDYYHRRPCSPRTQTRLADIDQRLRADRRCFTVRLARAGNRSEAQRCYEIVKIDGCFRRSDCSSSSGNFPIVSQLIRRSRSSNAANSVAASGSGGSITANPLQHDAIAQAALHGISGNDIVLVAMARIIRLPRVINRLLDSNRLEYRTRHLIDGLIVDCDQRISLVAGYMKDEVRNLSPFSFIHQDDVRWVIVALRQMYDCYSDYGESCYRLLTRNGHFIYLQSRGYLEIEKSTNKVHSFVCVNTLLDEEEGRRKVQEMKKKFSVIIKTKMPSNSLVDVPASQNPQQLERIVLYLIENLQKHDANTTTSTTDNDADGSERITVSTYDSSSSLAVAATTLGLGSSSTSALMSAKCIPDGVRCGRTPPLALVPPEAASVKSCITKSVNIVNVTAAKTLQHQQNLKSPASVQGSDRSLSPASSLDQTWEEAMGETTTTIATVCSNNATNTNASNTASISTIRNVQQRPSVLQMTRTLPSSVRQPITNNNCHSLSSSPTSTASNTPSPPASIGIQTNHNHSQQQRHQQTSVLKRLHASPVALASDDSISPAKRGTITINSNKPPATINIHSPTRSIICTNVNANVTSSRLFQEPPTSDTKLRSVITTINNDVTRSLSEIRSRLSSPVPQYIQDDQHQRQEVEEEFDAIIVDHHQQHHRQQCSSNDDDDDNGDDDVMLNNIKSDYNNIQLMGRQQFKPQQQHPQQQKH